MCPGPRAKYTSCPQILSCPQQGRGPEQRPPQTPLRCTSTDSREHPGREASLHRCPVLLGALWLQATKHQLKLLTLPPQPHQTEAGPEATLLRMLPTATCLPSSLKLTSYPTLRRESESRVFETRCQSQVQPSPAELRQCGTGEEIIYSDGL